MKKAIYLSCTLFLCASAIVGCNNSNSTSEESTVDESTILSLGNLTGTWQGVGFAVGQGEEYGADYMKLTVEENGDYQLIDYTTEEGLMQGSMSVSSDDTLSLNNEEDSTIIIGWENISKSDDIQCVFLNSDSIALTYEDISYIFAREDSSLEDFSLLDQTVSDLWYSDDGSSKDTTTYELSFNDTYFELYSITSKSDPQLLASFIYERNDGSSYTFYTYFNEDYTYPDFLSSVKTGEYTEVTIDFATEDNTLTLTVDGSSMNFYSNMIYGLETGSDSYELCDTSFQWAFDSVTHFCYFTMNLDTDTLYLYIADAENPDSAENVVCGEVEIDQDKKTMTYHFDTDTSAETSDSSSSLYESCKEMDDEVVSYTIDDKALSIELDGKNYNFTLEDY